MLPILTILGYRAMILVTLEVQEVGSPQKHVRICGGCLTLSRHDSPLYQMSYGQYSAAPNSPKQVRFLYFRYNSYTWSPRVFLGSPRDVDLASGH